MTFIMFMLYLQIDEKIQNADNSIKFIFLSEFLCTNNSCENKFK